MALKVKRSATFAKKEKSKGKISEEIQEKAQFEGFKSLASAYLAEKKKSTLHVPRLFLTSELIK